MNVEAAGILGLDQPHDILDEFVDIDGLLVGRPAGAEQRVDQRREAIGFADHDVGVFAQLVLAELAFEQLRGATDAAERILDLVRQLPNHLASCAVLDQQRVFAADLRAARNVDNLHEQARVVDINRRYVAVDHAFDRVNLGRREPHFVREVITRDGDARQDFTHLGFVIDQAQQGLAARPRPADAEYVFGCRRSGRESAGCHRAG